jgi:uncharacterized protein YgiM (DUF1202 family)
MVSSAHAGLKNRLFKVVSSASAVIVAAAMLTVAGPLPAAHAAALPDSIVDGGFIISDEEFFDGDAMTAEQIQEFLDARVKKCSTGSTCLKDFTETHPDKAADKYCSALVGGEAETAATILNKVAIACGVSPKVLLVMLQKEQSLVTMTNPSKSRYDRAMGYACPDSGPNNTANCNTAYYGFANQVYHAARQMQVYTQNPTLFNYRPGRTNTIKWHPSTECGTSRVYIQNQATANLYIYTPYRANVAALAAGTSTGDGCSSYGNRNFYNYYVSWFAPEVAPESGAPAQVSACAQPLAADIAANSVTATVVGVDWLNVRRGPSTLCNSGITTLAKGATIKITGQYGSWSRASVGGNVVWLATEYLSFPGGVKPSAHVGACLTAPGDDIKFAAGSFTVNIDSLNVRYAPSTSCSFGVSTLSKNAKVTQVGTYDNWTLIKVGSTHKWVMSEFLTKVETAPAPAPAPAATTTKKMVTSGKVNLRASNTTSSKILTVIQKGKTVTVTGSKGVWRKVTVGSRTGWLHSDYLKNPPASTTKKVTKTVTVKSLLNFRTSASTSSKKLGTFKKGTKLSVIAQKGVWLQINYGGRKGWVHSSYVK